MAQPTAATTSRPTPPDPARHRFGPGPRLAAIVLGLTGLCWSWYGWQARVVPVRFGEVAAKIVAGATYEPGILSATADTAERHLGARCDLRVRRDIVIIRARVADLATERGDIDRLDEDTADLDRAAAALLACSAGESFGWLARYGVALRREGLSPASLDLLRRSYRSGPREGWIAVRRNRMALSNFSRLPADLKASALVEYREMISSRLEGFAADTFANVPHALQAELVGALTGLGETDRYRFVIALRVRRVDVDAHGIDVRPDRPWWKY